MSPDRAQRERGIAIAVCSYDVRVGGKEEEMRRTAVWGVLSLFLVVVGLAGLGNGGTTWTVDDDPGADFTSIQAAIDAASDGDTIQVAAGLYEEILTITESVTILGPTAKVNKNGYVVPAGYAWDTSVEAVIQPPAGSENADVVYIDDADDVTLSGFVIQALDRGTSGDRMLIHTVADDKSMERLNIVNNVIGPNTNVTSQDGTRGRMNIDLDINPRNADQGLTDSLLAGNKIFGCEGDGNCIFVWASYESYGAAGPSPMTGTVFEDNEISNGHRAAIELCGGLEGLIVRNNVIHDFWALPGDDPTALKYGQGITLIRGSSDTDEASKKLQERPNRRWVSTNGYPDSGQRDLQHREDGNPNGPQQR